MNWPPYREYAKTRVDWLEELPSGWSVSRLGFEAWVRARLGWKGLKADEYVADGFAFLSTPDIRSSEINFKNVARITEERYVESPEIMLRVGDVLLAKDGSTLGSVNILRRLPEPATVNGSIAVITPGSRLQSGYLHYLLKSGFIFNRIQMLKGGMGVPHLFQDDIRRFDIPLPPLSEQQSISAFLDNETSKSDAVICKQEQLIATLREDRAAAVTNTVTKGLDSTADMKESGVEWLDKIPSTWSISRLGFETWVRARLGWKGLKADEYVDDGFALLATPNIRPNDIDFENVSRITAERYAESPEIMLRNGDVLLAKDGSTLGSVNLVRHLREPATVNGSIAVITPGKQLNSTYLYYLMGSTFIFNRIQMLKGGMGVPHLFQDDIRQFRIPLPPLSEQESISAFLDGQTAKVDALIDKASTVIGTMREYREAIITDAVTGKIDVRRAA